MTNELAIRGNFDVSIIPPLQDYATAICKTDFVPSALRNRPEAVLACIMTGQELGIGPMQSLRQIYNFDGKTGLAAELMRALVLHHGHRIWFGQDSEYTTTRVVCYGVRGDNGDDAKVEWTWDQAVKAGYHSKDNWKKSPRSMMAARASMELCRLLFPDIVAGMAYSVEELQDGYDPYADDTVADGEIVEETAQPKTTTTRTAPPARKRATKKSPPPSRPPADSAPEPELPDDEEIVDAEIVDERVESYAGESKDIADLVKSKDEQTPEQKERANQVVRLAKALKIDHHPIVSAITAGVTDSARMLSGREASDVMNAIRGINDGLATCEDRGDGRMVIFWKEEMGESVPNDEVIEAEIVDDEEEEDDPEGWDADNWRAFLAGKNIKVIALIRRAAEITKDGATPIGNLNGIAGSGRARELRDWVEGGSER